MHDILQQRQVPPQGGGGLPTMANIDEGVGAPL